MSASKSLIPEWQGLLTESLSNLTALTALGMAQGGADLSDLGKQKIQQCSLVQDATKPKGKGGDVFERCVFFLCDL